MSRPLSRLPLIILLVGLAIAVLWRLAQRMPTPPAASAAAAGEKRDRSPAPETARSPGFDRRTAVPPPEREKAVQDSRSAKLAAVERLAALVSGARVDFDPRSGSPQFVASNAALLTGANGEGGAVPVARAVQFTDEAHGIVKAFIAEHSPLFGHGPEVLESATVTRDYTTAHNRARTTVWQQEHSGIRIFEAVFQAHLTANGALVNVASQFLADPRTAAAEGHRANPQALIEPPITARRAVRVAGDSLGERFPEEHVVAMAPAEGPSRKGRFRAPALLDVTAELVWLPIDEGAMRLCWEVICVSRKRAEMFRTLVDAENGEAMVLQGLTEAISPASYRVFTSDSPTPMSPGHATPSAAQPSTVARELVTTEALNPTASPEGWIADGENETRGNNVDAHLDLNSDNVADLPRPQGVNRTFDPPLDLSQPPQSYRNAAVVNLFYWNNVIHDRYYDLGFTEAAGNFQQKNFGRGGLENDPIQADAQDGSGTNNANFSTPPDGSAGRMQMFVFTGPTPHRDSALDAEIIIHEYTHGLTNRLVGGGVGMSALQSRGMGEGWSDFYALCLLSEAADNPNGTYAKGGYSSRAISPGFEENYYFGIRRYPYSTDLARNPLTFRDIDPSQASAHAGIPLSPRYAASNANPSQVHGQGEFWCATLWGARANLVAKHGLVAGNDLALRLVTDGLKLAPPNPTFVQARDAIIQAEMVYTGGANRNELWAAFAKRGLGAAAAAPQPGTTTGVIESFDIPDSLAVFPPSIARAEGSIGGPFLPARHEFTISNSAPEPVPWTASVDATWLTLSHTSGTLATGAAVKVEATLNGGAMNLPAGTYTATLRVTNSSTGLSQTRTIPLLVDYLFLPVFSDDFESVNLDPASWTITGTGPHRTQLTSANAPRAGLQHLTMDATGSGVYARNEATLTLNLAGRSNLVLRFWAKSFSDEPDGPPPSPFIGGADFDGVAVSEDGTTWHEVFPLRSLTAGWKQFTVDLDEALAARGLSYTSAFKIRFNHYDNLEIATDGFAFDDIVIAEAVNRRLSVALPPRALEGGPAATAVVSVTPVQSSPLLVVLSSSASTEVAVPATVEIPAGASNATFTVSFPDDAELDGTQFAVISATADTFVPGSAEVLVDDTELATLSIDIPASAVEGGGALTGTVHVDSAPTKAVRVILSTSELSDLIVPPFVEIPAGEISAPFFLNVIDDTRLDGTVVAQITASVTNWVSGVAAIEILDNENNALVLEPPPDLREGNPQRTAKVTIAGTLTNDLVLAARSSNPSECTVPASVTLYAGQTVATIPVTVIDDDDQDGVQNITLTVSAPGFAEVSSTVQVRDNEVDHFEVSEISSPQVKNAPVSVTVNARDIGGDLITNFNGPATFTLQTAQATLPVSPLGGAFVGGVLEAELRFGADADAATLRVNDPAGHSGSSNTFAIGRGPMSAFAFDPIPPVQQVDNPFPITIRAVDAGGNAAEEYAGSVILESRAPGPREPTSVGKSQSPSGINSGYRQSRLQCIYTPAEVRGAGRLTGVQMNLLVPPAAPLKRFTVRVKHTDLSAYPSSWSVWETSGWTTVYQADRAFPSAGWVDFPFSEPFDYDGTRNLMIDFSYYDPNQFGSSGPGAAYQTDGVIGGSPRKAYYFSHGSQDPLTWPQDWFASTTSNLPILRFGELQPHYVRPALSGTFVNGIWSGSVSLPAAQPSSALAARDQSTGSTGMSNLFRVSPPLPTPGSGVIYQENFESGLLSSQWQITGTANFQSLVTTLNGPHAGLRHLTMSAGQYDYQTSANWVTWSLNLEGLQALTLKFWAKGFGDSPQSPPPSPFSNTAQFDGVAISADGVSWFEVQPLRSSTGGPLSSTWVQYTVDLEKAVKAAGLAFNSDFKVRFAQVGSDRIPYSGIAIDDIELLSAPAASAVRVSLPAQVQEGGPAVIGTVSIPFLAPEDILVTLGSNAPAKLTVPAQVLLPRGQRAAEFLVQAVDDNLADGSKTVGVTASAPYLPSSGSTLLVVDNDAGDFTFSVPVTEVVEGEAPIQGVITLSRPAAGPLVFQVSSSDPTAINPATGIPTVVAGGTSVVIPLTIINDTKIDGPQTAVVTVSKDGVTARSPVITVADNETLNLRLTSSSSVASLREGQATTLYAYLPGTVTTPTEVTFSSSDSSRIIPPAPQIIAAGSTYAYVTVTAADDAIPSIPGPVVLTVSAPGFNSASYTVTYLDNDPDHFTITPIPSPVVIRAPVPVAVTARSADGGVLEGFTGTVALSGTGVIIQPAVSGTFIRGVWSAEVTFVGPASGARMRADAAGGAFGQSNPFDVGTGEYRALTWDSIPPSAAPGADIPIRVRAVDAGGNSVPATETITPRLMVPMPGSTVGESNTSTSNLLYTYGRRARSQALYLASDLGGPSTVSGMEFFVRSGASGQNLSNLIIRMKATTRVNLAASDGWDSSGWTTVHRSNRTVDANGWFTCIFDTPWTYDGMSSVLVDISYNSPVANTATLSWNAGYSSAGGPRILYGYSSTDTGDPLMWTGTDPYPSESYYLPSLRLLVAQPAPAVLPTTAQLVNGVWSGTTSFPGELAAAFLHAVDSSGRQGYSNRFTVSTPVASSLPFIDGFETGSLSPTWTTSGTGSGRTRVLATNAPYSGTRHAVLDSNYSSSRAELTLARDLRGYSGVTLAFWAKRFGGASDGPPPSPFIGGANFDGVAISADGTTWYEVQPLRGMTSGVWSQFSVPLDAATSARSLEYTREFRIRFNHFGYDYAPYDGIAIDDVAITGNPTGRLRLIVPASIAENGGIIPGTVFLPSPAASSVNVTLTSSGGGILSVPASVTIPAGETSAAFGLTPVHRPTVTGRVKVNITASAPDWVDGIATTQVTDQETATIVLTAPALLSESDGSANAILSISPAPAASLTVALSSSLPASVQVPSTVSVAPGQSSVSVPITIVGDSRFSGPRNVTLRSEIAGWPASESVLVLSDDEIGRLSMSPTVLEEGATGTISVSAWYAPDSDVVVSLASADPSRLVLPQSVTILANTYSVSIPYSVPNNDAIEGAKPVTVTATAPGMTSASAAMILADNDVDHFTFDPIGPVVRGKSFPVTLRARDLNDAAITTFTGTVNLAATGDAGAIEFTPKTTAAFVAGIWTGNVTINTFSEDVRLRATELNGATGESGSFTVGVGGPAAYVWSAILTNQVASNPFPAQIVARDAGGNPLPNHTGYVFLSAPPAERIIGSGTSTIAGFPLNTNYHDQRTQILYLAGEVGAGGPLASLSLYVAALPGQILNRWTIRLKHTTLANQATSSFESTGWATVYQQNQTFTSTGWVTFTFDVPFQYDGTSNLLVDLSFNNASYSWSSGAVRMFSSITGNRVRYAVSDSWYGDPLTWSGSTPFSTSSSSVPQAIFNRGGAGAAVAPAVALLRNGSWDGQVLVASVSSATNLHATDSAGATGISNQFSVSAAPDADNDHLPDFWENEHALSPNDANAHHGPDGDIDGDGIPNLLEFALNLNPRRFDLHGTPTAAWAKNPADGKDYLEFSFRRRIGSPGLNYTIETASEVNAWTSDSTKYQQVGLPAAVGDGITEVVTVRVLPAANTPGVPARFGRVRIAAP